MVKKSSKKDDNNKNDEEGIVTVQEEIIGPFRVSYVIRKQVLPKKRIEEEIEDTTKSDRQQRELNIKAIESLRRRAIQELESDTVTPNEKIDACWRLLHLCGFQETETIEGEVDELLLQQRRQRKSSSSDWLRGGF